MSFASGYRPGAISSLLGLDSTVDSCLFTKMSRDVGEEKVMSIDDDDNGAVEQSELATTTTPIKRTVKKTKKKKKTKDEAVVIVDDDDVSVVDAEPVVPVSDDVALAKDPTDESDVVDEDEAMVPDAHLQPSRRRQVLLESSKPLGLWSRSCSSRTVFIGNLPSTSITKKKLLRLCTPFGTVESARLRDASRPDDQTTKKVAVIKKRFNANRNSINGYVKFEKVEDALKCVEKLRGHRFEDHVLNVNMANEHGVRSNEKAVFVGNLNFAVNENELHDHFRTCGHIESVRVVRDKESGLGKGFGYVNFEKQEEAAKAVQVLDGSSLNNRLIRVKPCSEQTSNKNKSRASHFDKSRKVFDNRGGYDKKKDFRKGSKESFTKGSKKDLMLGTESVGEKSFMGTRVKVAKEGKRMKMRKEVKKRRELSEKLLRS